MEDKRNQKQPVSMKKSTWRSILGKKWAFPAIYIGTAAIILAFVMWYQGSLLNQATKTPQQIDKVTVVNGENKPATVHENEEAVAVNNTTPTLAWPVAKEVMYEIGMGFFNEEANADEQSKSLVKFNDSFVPHTGIDLISTNGKGFDVAAAGDGKVMKVYNDQLVGNLVEIEHANKLVSVYQSLEKVTVKENDEVKQGQVIGTAGRNVFEKDAKAHLHFEVRMDGNSVDPHKFLKEAQPQ
ncbi:M23 family metallopeptidase [Brevibacillus laterosporus]|uniref:Stage II sporulation protein Q n=1 Tax=Brevibacillus laterosporus LMG 15441 TaxID=1042163 RepID=A0A075RHK6_BRELA|nr:M23 family metallopeptidase [Brevibacillus laterosporus]WPS87611.1 M23 family metallopeptidase [Brevibacillus halotolerans]AIG28675.1 stage II sporulation protein Q [Brevibacillus laterosporus LMG 15441]AUM67006.1 M23 family peptidase [Brevibacillus laterosporus]ERM17075.1 peptidase M23 [Brevibacillus laterosporus PE36]RJL12003.1 M23 family peptidase [Brevibacillus laterosporus]